MHLSDKKDEFDAKRQTRRMSNTLREWEAARLASASSASASASARASASASDNAGKYLEMRDGQMNLQLH